MQIFDIQHKIANQLANKLKKNKRVKPIIETGLGKGIIYCLVADILYPKTVSVLVKQSVVQYQQRIIDGWPNCKLKLNKVNTDYIIDDNVL